MALSFHLESADRARTPATGDNIDDKLGQIDPLTEEQQAAALRLLTRLGADDLAEMLGLADDAPEANEPLLRCSTCTQHLRPGCFAPDRTKTGRGRSNICRTCMNARRKTTREAA